MIKIDVGEERADVGIALSAWPYSRWIAALARQSLIAEVELTPKPGLVDRRGSGAHTDLSLATMKQSASAIEPYFREMAEASQDNYPCSDLRQLLGILGRNAELAMLKATGGSNAHKGSIWTLGLLISAAAMLESLSPSASHIALRAREIALLEDRAMPYLVTNGEAVLKRYGVTGARGEARDGFPHIVHLALPMLRRERSRGMQEEVARLNTLLVIMSKLDDTCLLHRGGERALTAAKRGAISVLEAGGVATELGSQNLSLLDGRLLEMKISPGGSADLLAATLFLDAVERNQPQILTTPDWWRFASGNN